MRSRSAVPLRHVLLISSALMIMTAAGSLASSQELPEGATDPRAVLLPAPAGEPLLRGEAEAEIAEMVAGVNADSVHAFLERLTGETLVSLDYGDRLIRTRYTYAEGAQKAAEFLRDVFESYGYDVEYQICGFPVQIRGLHTAPGGPCVAVCTGGFLLRSPDGLAWSRVKAGIDTVVVTFHSVDLAAAGEYVAVGDRGTVVTSYDGGWNWVPRTSTVVQPLNAVSVHPNGVGWAVGAGGTIVKTTDAGAHWSSQASGVASVLQGVAALDSLRAVAVGDGGLILRTTNGGASWASVTSGTTQTLREVSFFGERGWAVGDAGTILRSVNGGASWLAQTSGTTRTLWGVSFADALNGWAVGSLTTILHTSDGGLHWAAQTAPVSGNFVCVHAASSSAAWVGAQEVLLRTVDQGVSWEDQFDAIHEGWGNVIATRVGTTTPAEEVLLGGHFDSYSQSAYRDTLAPGADDNGSGIAAIVEAARNMSDHLFERTVRFVCFSGEEQGLLGSDFYAQQAQEQGAQIVALFNLDSVGWNDDYLRIFSNASSAWFGDVALQMAAVHAPGLPVYHWDCPGCNWSDHYSFWNHSFDAIVGIETWDPAPPQHHTIGDTLGLMNMALVADVTRIVLATTATVAGVDTVLSDVASADPGDRGRARPGALRATWPNPAREGAIIHLSLPRAGRVTLRVYDTSGRLVRTLRDGSMPSGSGEVAWDLRGTAGERVAPGIYTVRLEAAGESGTLKLAVVR